MPKRKAPLKKHTLHLREGDFEYLVGYYAGTSTAPSEIIRLTVSALVDNLRRKEESAAPKIKVEL